MSAVPVSKSFEQARYHMVEQQIRPWSVLDQSVLDLMGAIRREDYAPPRHRALALMDLEIPLDLGAWRSGESMLAPRVEARLLQELTIKPHEQVLEVGTGSGFMAALAAHKARHVLTVEIEQRLARFGAENLARGGVRNAQVELGDGSRGWPARAPYDVIILSGSTPLLPAELLAQLKPGGRLAAIVGDAPAMTARIVTCVADGAFETLDLFETCIKPLRNARHPPRFVFR
jgi:protein-L-isoaspartate(D-aspartate) O-methyltransferase